MYRHLIFVLVASFLIVSCKNNDNGQKDRLLKLYEQAYTNHDYQTAIVHLNELITIDTVNVEDYYDSLAFYYLKKVQNFYAGKKIVEKAVVMFPENVKMLEFQSIFKSADNKLEEANSLLDKAYKLSNKYRYLYMKAALLVQGKDYKVEEFTQTLRKILDDPNYKKELVEDQFSADYPEQLVDLKAKIYTDFAQLSLELMNDKIGSNIYIDSALRIQPDYQKALYMKQQLKSIK